MISRIKTTFWMAILTSAVGPSLGDAAPIPLASTEGANFTGAGRVEKVGWLWVCDERGRRSWLFKNPEFR
jgi:hypothetical protein